MGAGRQAKGRSDADRRSEAAEDLDSARLVARFQAGDREAYTALYQRYFDRVFAYLKIALRDSPEAEDLTQQVFVQALEALPRYEQRGQPVRAWLFRIVRNQALTQLRKDERLELVGLDELERPGNQPSYEESDLSVLGWITDPDLLMFVERLPVVQRQATVLRYMLDLPSAEVAKILGLTPDHVRVLQSRAVAYLKDRLTSLGRAPKQQGTEQSDPVHMKGCETQALVARSRRYALGGP